MLIKPNPPLSIKSIDGLNHRPAPIKIVIDDFK